MASSTSTPPNIDQRTAAPICLYVTKGYYRPQKQLKIMAQELLIRHYRETREEIYKDQEEVGEREGIEERDQGRETTPRD